MPVSALPMTQPGVYPVGTGGNPTVTAPMLRECGQQQLWYKQNIVAGTTTSIAVQLARTRAPYYYPWGAAVEVAFSGNPGTFEVDVQFAETDNDNNYVTVGTIANAQMNGTYVARYDMPNTVFPKYVRLFAKTFPNAVTASALITR